MSDVYVDDLTMLGPRESLGKTLQRIRRVIDMEDPHELGKYRGCYHRLLETKRPRTGETVTEVEWDMSAYNGDASFRYEAEPFREGKPFHNAATPFAPKQDGATFDKLLASEGGMSPKEVAPHLIKFRTVINTPA